VGLLVTAGCAASVSAQVATIAATEPDREFSCEAFPSPVSEKWLIERFGAENVVTDSIVGGDDGPFPGTVVFPDSAECRFEVAWRDEPARTAARWIRIRGGSRWITAHGFGLDAD